jgi:hypothetical protein
MPNGRPTRRATPRVARGFVLLIVTLALCAGCQRFPLRYTEVSPESTSRPTTRVESGSSEVTSPADLPALPATITDAAVSILPEPVRVPFKSTSSPTPHLDSALARAEGTSVAPLDAAVVRAGEIKADSVATHGETPVELPILVEKADKKTEPAGGPTPNVPIPLVDRPPAEPPTTAKEPPTAAVTPVAKEDVKPLDTPSEKVSELAPAPAPKAIDPEKAPEPIAMTDDWGANLGRLRELARRRAGEPGDAAEAWAIRAHVLDWLAGDGDKPVSDANRAWNQVLAALSAATGQETVEPGALAHHLGSAVETLEAFAPLRINDLHLCRKVNGFGSYEVIEGPALRAGQPLLVYCEMTGLAYEPGAGSFRSRLSSQVEVVPAGGGEPVMSQPLGTAEDDCRHPRRDYYVNYRLVLPARMAPGAYTLRLTQTDLISGRAASSDVSFSVEP